MTEISIDELKKIQLDILKKVDDFNKKNKINYSLYFGSLLGAVRHQGYIPWDDDIDLMMPRRDYEKFIKNFELCQSKYKIKNSDNDNNFYSQYTKIFDPKTRLIENANVNYNIGVNIDLFPIDGLPKNSVTRIIFLSTLKLLHSILIIKSIKLRVGERTSLKFLILLLLKGLTFWIPRKLTSKTINTLIKKYSFEKSEFVMHTCFSQFKLKDKFHRKIFQKFKVRNFEGLLVSSISNEDLFLTSQYGDYMKLPPINKRVTHHDFKAYKITE